MLRGRWRRRLPLIRQSETAECGLACLAMVAGYHGYDVDLNTLRRKFPLSPRGVRLDELMRLAERLGFAARALRLEPDDLPALNLPAVLHWNLNHFVVLKEVGRSHVIVHDPARGRRRVDLAELSASMTGIVLELAPRPDFEKKREVEGIGLGRLIGRVPGFATAIAQALVLSAVLQAFILVSPLYIQLAVDRVLTQGDRGWLVALAVGFALFTVFNVAAEALRSLVVLRLGSLVSFQIADRLFRHLILLPLSYFERREIGGLISRFNATQPIRDLVTGGVVAVLVDGVMAAATLVLMLAYSWVLGAVVLGGLLLTVALRLALFGRLRQRTEHQLEERVRQDSTFIESARAIQAIKLFGREADRAEFWKDLCARYANAALRLGGLQVGFTAATNLVLGLETVVTIFLATRLALADALTVGMLFAFLSYRQQFLDKSSRLAEKAIELRMVGLHVERLGDIVLAPIERGLDRPANAVPPLAGAIELRSVSYRYAESEPYVFENVDLRVEPGDFVAITGPSGGGKTTLLKVMLSLFEPSGGEVLFDGRPIETLGLQGVRAQLAAVMQEDHLLKGSLLDNIAFFDPAADRSWAERCAALAGIDADIRRMPLGYETHVGDMGSTLSGGQRQRLFLARALYRKPRLLFLDEATSHLEPALEAEINAALQALAITRIVIAHRPQTVAAARRRFILSGGRLREIRGASADQLQDSR